MTYHDQTDAKNILKLREILKEMPIFIRNYFSSIADQCAPRTRLGYAYDLKIFLGYLSSEVFDGTPIGAITVSQFAQLQSEELQGFMEYLSYYVPIGEPDGAHQNKALGKSRKLAAIRGLFKYLYMGKKIASNPAELVAFPKTTQKAITTLEVNEIAKLLDTVDSGESLTPHQKKYHEITRIRDAAIITLLLGTGMRVSECVGINIADIDFDTSGIKVTRKGGDEMVLYYGNEVEAALAEYIELRKKIVSQDGHEDALFLSIQNRRMTDRAIQKMVKKYAQVITKLKTISPHKLRSTFGTQLYAETGDIYLVANVLGHADVNTTRKHYAKMDESYRRRAANAVRLRD